MKICQVTMYYCPLAGGQQTYIRNLLRVLVDNKIEPSVLQPRRPNCKPDVYTHFSPHIPKGHYLGKVLDDWSWFIFNFSLFFSKKFLAKHDILISHYPFHIPSLLWHKKVLIVSHGVLWQIPPRTFFDRYHYKISKQIKQKKLFLVANDTHFLREIGYDISPGEAFFEEISTNVWFIPNCIDTSYFKPSLDVPKEKIILVPRNIRKDRGIHLAIEAFRLFEEKNPGYTLQIAGGPTYGEYYDYCISIADTLQLSDKVIFIGDVKWEHMINLYHRSAITLIPTIEKEGTSLSALESMACGTPVVSTNVAGLLDLPCLKAEPKAEAIYEQLTEVLVNLVKYSFQQQTEVHKVFNLLNWQNAWMKAIKAVNER